MQNRQGISVPWLVVVGCPYHMRVVRDSEVIHTAKRSRPLLKKKVADPKVTIVSYQIFR